LIIRQKKKAGLFNTKGTAEDNLKVNCYSGHTYAERPRSFIRQGIEYEVEEMEGAWQEPGERHFKVRTQDNKFFHLCYNETQKQWSLTGPVRRPK